MKRSEPKALLLAVAALPTLLAATLVDRVAAVVNDEVISLSEVYELGGDYIDQKCAATIGDACRSAAEIEVLEPLILRALVHQELARLEMDVRGEDVEHAIDAVIQEYGFADRDALRAEIERAGSTWDGYRAELEDQIRMQRFRGAILAPRVVVTDDEVRDQYQRVVRDYEAPKAVKLRALGYTVPAETPPSELADLVQRFRRMATEVEAGARTWEGLSEEFDTAGVGPVFAGRQYKQGQLTAQIDAVAFSTEVGTVSEPVLIGGVLYLLRIDEIGQVEGQVRSFEEAEANLRGQLFESRLDEAEDEWYAIARRQAAVDVRLGAD